MDISTVNGRIAIVNNGYGVAKTLSAYICTPDRDIVCRIKGITAFDVMIKGLNDFSQISFQVQKYTTNQSTLELELNESYAQLHSFCEIFIPEFGSNGYFIILNEPTISSTGKMAESKSFTAFSYEAVLQYRNLIGFKVNQGTADSLEMNPSNLDVYGIPSRFIVLYDPDNKDYSLLDLVLREDYYGWQVGTVDPSIANLSRSFDIENQNVYSFLCNDAAKAFRCVFQFDTAHKLINVTSIENFGESTNIYLSLSHFLNQIDIAPQTEDIYTVFNVRGDNDLDISWVNFGSNKIYNIDYPLSLLGTDIQNAYNSYKEHRDSLRESYTEKQKKYANLLQIKQSIEYRIPIEETANNWTSTTYYSDDALDIVLTNGRTIVSLIESSYKNKDGSLDEEALEMSPDASRYYSYKSIIIPDVQAEIAARENDEHNENPVDTMFVYNVYGLIELRDVRRKQFNDRIKALTEQGYNEDSWNPAMTIAEITWNAHHQEYLKYKNELTKLDQIITKKESQVADIDNQINNILSDMRTIAENASLENYDGLTRNQKDVIKSLYRESDYTDSNYLLTDFDDAVSIVVRQDELYEAAEARLEVESVPQFSWTVTSANLYAIPEFKELRDQLQIGDFITLGFDMYGIADFMADKMEYKEGGIKFRVIEIDFDGINFSGNFQINFSNMIQTAKYRNDFETLLDSFVSSKTNQITAGVTGTASAVAANVAASLIRPYIEAQEARFDNAILGTANINDLTATNAKVGSLVADYIHTDEFIAELAEITNLTVFDLKAAQITADKSINLVSDSTGSISIYNSSMVFKDENGDVRVSIGRKQNGVYDISIYSEANSQGEQDVLFDSTGIHKSAFQTRVIETQMVEWSTIAAGVDSNKKPYFSACQVETNEGERLDVALNKLKAIEISTPNQFFVISDDDTYDPAEIMLTATLKVVSDRGQIEWYYQDENENWYLISNTTVSSIQPYLTNDNNIIIPYAWDEFSDTVVIKAVYGNNELSDTITLFKVKEGTSTINAIFSNEAQTIATDNDNYPTDDKRYTCDVLVLRGTTALSQIASLPTVNQYTMTATCSEPSITIESVTNGRITFKTDSTIPIPDNFAINVVINVGGFITPITKQISLSASSAGEATITVEIQSSSGVLFKNRNINSVLTAKVWKGGEDITDRATSFKWTRKDQYGNPDPSWTRILAGSSITITSDDVLNKSIFECEVSFS